MERLPAPNLDDDQILRVITGLRPYRHGGVRLEAEIIDHTTIIHNYGHGGGGLTLSWGCAAETADLVTDATSPGETVAILGAGVIGLTTALRVLQSGRRVRIYTNAVHPNTTSSVAGAKWLPTGVDRGPDFERFSAWLRTSWRTFHDLDQANWGVRMYPCYEACDNPDAWDTFKTGTLDQPEFLDELPLPGPARSGHLYRTFFMETPVFMRTLANAIESRGGEIIHRDINSLEDTLALDEHVIVNATGLASRTIFNDEAVVPARGQLVLLKPQPIPYLLANDYKYLFPRKDAMIAGGSFEIDVWDTTPEPDFAQRILDHHRKFFGMMPGHVPSHVPGQDAPGHANA